VNISTAAKVPIIEGAFLGENERQVKIDMIRK
jgi:hypothetical protein